MVASVACSTAAGLVAIATPTAATPSAWKIAPSPDSGTSSNQLDGVSCHPATSCMAVGFSYSQSLGADQTLIESWNGTRWSIVPSPNNGDGTNNFLGVSCASASWCEAVGFSVAGGATQALIESWNGRTWSIDSSPNTGSTYSILDGVSCRLATRSCQAVGYDNSTSLGVDQTLIESWHGGSWSIVPSPNNGSAENILYGVSCVATRWCQAVGYYNSTSLGTIQTLIEMWNGSTWSIVPSPNGTNSTYLLGVSCRAATRACQAVGQVYNTSLQTFQTLDESWNGSSWSIVPSPNQGASINDLLGVSCDAGGTCEAVGLYFDTSLGSYQTLVESWNGRSWSIVPSPDNGTGYNVLAAVSCRRRTRSCQAVGNYKSAVPDSYQNLIESNG
jgi:hypothetical protein